jgi:regulator of replication initiation timing
MTPKTSLNPRRSHARSDELALVDRLVRLRHAIAGMAHDLGTLRRQHVAVQRENENLRREVARLRREVLAR